MDIYGSYVASPWLSDSPATFGIPIVYQAEMVLKSLRMLPARKRVYDFLKVPTVYQAKKMYLDDLLFGMRWPAGPRP